MSHQHDIPESGPAMQSDADATSALTVAALDRWESEVDPVQRARLSAARHRALSVAGQRQWTAPRWLVPAIATGFAMVLAIGLRAPRTVPVDPASVVVMSETPDPIGSDDLLNPDADPDADLYLWLSGNDDPA